MIWPRISVITPSFNQGQFIESTIQSVLDQDYPNLEYIIIDGGSSDESVRVIQRYAHHLSHWESQPDRGQSHAINKGLTRATGEIHCWLNSDDRFAPNCLKTVANHLHSGTGHFALVGHSIRTYLDERDERIDYGKFKSKRRLLRYWRPYQIHQPSTFWRAEVTRRVGLLKETLHNAMDYDYWVRIAQNYPFENIDQVLSIVLSHPDCKTADDFRTFHQEMKVVAREHWGGPFQPKSWPYRFEEMWRKSRITHPINT